MGVSGNRPQRQARGPLRLWFSVAVVGHFRAAAYPARERGSEGELPDTVSKIEGLMLLIYYINVINLLY